MSQSGTTVESMGIGAVGSHLADEIVARLERLPFSRFHLHLAAILGVGTFFDAFDSVAISVALAVIFTTLHIGFVNAGLLISSAFVGQFVGAIVVGYLSEMYGRRLTYVFSLGSFGLLSVLAAVSWNFESLLAIRLLEGLGLGAAIPISVALFNEWIRGGNRGRVFILFQSMFPWALFITPLIGALCLSLFGNLGWRVLFGLGGIPMVIAIYAFFRLPDSPRWLADKGRPESAARLVERVERQYPADSLQPPEIRYRADVKATRFGELFSRQYLRRTVVTWVQFFTSYFGQYGYTVWLPTLYVTLGHLPAQLGLLLSAATSFVSLIVAYVVAFTIDRIGRKLLFSIGFAVASVGAFLGFVFVVVLHQTTWQTLFITSLIMVIGEGPSNIGAYLYAPELYPTRMRAWATAASSSMSRVASFIAPVVVGALLAAKAGVGGVFLIFCVNLLIGLVVMVAFGIETKRKVLEEISA